jgi:arylsulfatase A-like enzyme
MDNAVGRVLDALEKNGLIENTIIISTTDHGIAFPDMKAHLRDAGIGVSFMMRGPGVFSKPRVCDALLSQIDVFPTLCDHLGIARPSWLTGNSFLPILYDEKSEINDAVFAEVTYHSAYEPKRCVRTLRYKYIRRFDDRTQAVLPNCDDGPSKTYWMKQGWKELPLYQEEELYDLDFDPSEHRNLANDPGYKQTLDQLRERLVSWMKSTSDPLLKGPVPVPLGGRTSPVNGDSPREKMSPLKG